MTVSDELRDRYQRAAHAMQTGVAAKMAVAPAETQAKHLRTGINSALVSNGALVALLVKKGVIGEDEYATALCEMMEEEVAKYEEAVSALYNSKVNLS